MPFFVPSPSELLSKAKEESKNSIAIWFRRKYSLSPKDPRYLDITFEEMLQEYFLEKVEEKPDIKIEELIQDKTLDSNWIEEQQQEEIKESLKKRFANLNDEDFETLAEDKR
jgi:hypothetical protein